MVFKNTKITKVVYISYTLEFGEIHVVGLFYTELPKNKVILYHTFLLPELIRRHYFKIRGWRKNRTIRKH